MQGLKIDMNLCKSTETNIQIQIKGLNSTNLGSSDLYNINSDYYNDRCLPISANQSAATLDEKRSQFDNLNYTCGSKCTYEAIDTNNSYISCNCNSSQSNLEISPEYGKIILNTLDSFNAVIITCYHNFLIFVSYFIK